MVRIQTRIFFLCVVMEIYLLVYLVLIWLQNMWWYRPSGAGLWIAFQSISIVCTVCTPTICFGILIFEQVVAMRRRLKI